MKRAASLAQKKHREIERLFLTEGGAFLDEARSTEREPLETFTEPEDIRRVSTLTNSTAPVGVFGYVDFSSEELLEHDTIVLLDGVQDPGNVGTVIRSAHAFGAGVALSKGCADLYNPKTVRATMGSIFHAKVAREVEFTNFLEAAKSAGFTSAAAVADVGKSPSGMGDGKLVIVVGSEGAGLSEEVVSGCDVRVSIPCVAESLNAAVAASILLYQAHLRVLP